VNTDFPDISLKKFDKVVYALLLGGGVVAGAAAVYGLYVLLPFLVELAQDTVMFGVLMLAAAALAIGAAQLWMMRDAIVHKMKLNARAFSRRIIKDDPIGSIDISIKRMEGRLNEAKERQTEANAATRVLERRIRNANDHRSPGVLDQAELEEQLAAQAERSGLAKEDVDAHLINAERFREAGTTLGELLQHQKERQAKLDEARKLAERGLVNLQNQKQVWSIKLDALNAELAQAKSFRSFFSRSPELETIDIAVEEIERAAAQAESEIEALFRDADPLLQREKLQREAEAATARARILSAQQTAAALPAAPVDVPVLPARKVIGMPRSIPSRDGAIDGGKK
jgi:hypothetical protein